MISYQKSCIESRRKMVDQQTSSSFLSLLIKASCIVSLLSGLILIDQSALHLSARAATAPSQPTPTVKPSHVLVDYIGGLPGARPSGVSDAAILNQVPLNNNIDTYFILAGARDTYNLAHQPTGNFRQDWNITDMQNISADVISQIEYYHTRVKFMASLMAPDPSSSDHDWKTPTDNTAWIANATNSLENLMDTYHLSGFDLDLESGVVDQSFVDDMFSVISNLKHDKNAIITFATFLGGDVFNTYKAIYDKNPANVDWINFQFYSAESSLNPVCNEQGDCHLPIYDYYRGFANIFGSQKVVLGIPSYSSSQGGVPYGLDPDHITGIVQNLLSPTFLANNNLPAGGLRGVMIWTLGWSSIFSSLYYSENLPNYDLESELGGLLAQGNTTSSNMLKNPSFENGLYAWGDWHPVGQASAQKVDTDWPHWGQKKLVEWAPNPYQETTWQVLNDLPNGTYHVGVWLRSSGGQNHVRLEVSQYNTNNVTCVSEPWYTISDWSYISCDSLQVTTGHISVGFYSDAHTNEWAVFDDAFVIRTA